MVCFYHLSLLAQTYIDVKINEWYKGFYDLLQKAPEEIIRFYDGIILFEIAIPYVIIYTIIIILPVCGLFDGERR